VPGVVSAEVSCVAGTAVCTVEPGTSVETLIDAIGREGFDATPKN
jgi:hypothetical protein